MKRNIIFMVLLSIITLTNRLISQEKYAVLITGDYAAKDIAIKDQWNHGEGKTLLGFEEFWYDTYLMWEMLVTKKGFSNDHIYVLFAGGEDFTKLNMWDRYNGHAWHPDIIPEGGQITDYSATQSNVEDVFNGLATGTNGFPLITADDFLFVWTFDHGGYEGPNFYDVYLALLPLIPGGNPYKMLAAEFAALVKPINANKKVYWMQQCSSGGFWYDLWEENFIFHSSCQYDEQSYQCDNLKLGNIPVTENEEDPSSGLVYEHGEFNFHNYSCMVGESPAFVNNYGGELYTDADLNGDSYISIYETYEWESSHESINYYVFPEWGETPLIIDDLYLGKYTSLEYPTLLWGNNLSSNTYRGLIGISKDIHITAGNQISFYENSKVYFLNNSKLIVDAGATIDIQDNVQFFGSHNNNIQVYGNIQVGQNIIFSKVSNASYFDGLYICNNNQNTLLNNVIFNNTRFHNYGETLNINDCEFNNCFIIESYRGNVSVTNSVFDRTWLYLENNTGNSDYIATVSGCNFNTNYTMAGIDLFNYGRYLIENNTIQGYYNGIQLNYSGYGTEGFQKIYRNHIYNSTQSGIIAYNTFGSIENNNIHDNRYGIRLMRNCNIEIKGNPYAPNNSETQQIKDNTSYEVYASQFSFPWYFSYNVIIDEDNYGNPNDPMVLHDRPNVPPLIKLDVRYNCWGNNFNPDQDLKTSNGVYKWIPTWCPEWTIENEDPIAEIYFNALNLFEGGNYLAAKSQFKDIIQYYPHSSYAQTALKDLFRIEEFVDKNYIELKEYYGTNDSIKSDTNLLNIGAYLSNFCEIKLENWPTAIAWFENVIQEPETFEDSIFAIIDLGYTYWLMENSGFKSSYTGTMPQYKFASHKDYEENRDYLLSLLPGDCLSETMKQSLATLKPGELLQNVPNPFNGTTQIWFKLTEESNISVTIYDYTGKAVSVIRPGLLASGNHSVEFNSANLSSGIYFYSLEVNGAKTDTKKMTLMR